MNIDVIMHASIALVGVFISSVSQVLLKKAALKHSDSSIDDYLNPLVIGAYILFIITTIISVYAYKGIPLSLGPILEATSYAYITIFGVKIFGEKVGRKKIIALSLILCGVLTYGIFG